LIGRRRHIPCWASAFLALCVPALAQSTPYRKIGEMELRLFGVTATLDPVHPVVPKNIPSAVRILVRAAGAELPLADAIRFLGPDLRVHGDLSGPGLPETVSLPVDSPGAPPQADPLLLPLPALTVSGNYTLANLRIESGGRSVLDVLPQTVTVEVIEQVLVTSVKTRSLTLDEIREKGIVLDSDDYLGFEFTLGLKLESQAVSLSFPVVFDRQGVAIPDPLTPPAAPTRQGVPMPTLVPLLLEAVADGADAGEGGGQRLPLTLPSGQPIRIPAVLVIPGNVGYLKQFFSAQLFVANGAPVGSGLSLRKVSGTIKLPPGADLDPGTTDDPLVLPETVRGPQPETLPILGLGPDGKPGTEDDDDRFTPGEQGQAEFLLRGEREGFHSLDFDLVATLDGLASGPVTIRGKASGGVLVRNPFFDMTFTVPSVVRRGERFKLYASVTNIGQGIANDVSVSLDAAALAGAQLVSDQTVHIDTLRTGDSKTVAFEFESQQTGQVVASYLKLDGPGQSGGTLRFSLGIGERGVPLSPDTLVLPAAVDDVPAAILDAAMRVLGQAWSVANAPSGTLPRGVVRTSKAVVVAKALALAEAGLRIGLGQDVAGSMEALDYDFFTGAPRDPGFDQLLHDTEAGQALRQIFGGHAPMDEPVSAGGPRLVAASIIGPEVLAGAGPFGLHAVLVFDRILDGPSAAVATRYLVPSNQIRSAKAILSGRLVVVSLAQPEGPYVPTTITVDGLLDLRGRRGGGQAELGSRLVDPGAVVTGRVLGADGTAVNTATVIHTNNADFTCRFPGQTGIASLPVDGEGRFEYRYVRRDNCGQPFEMVTQDPATGAVRKSSGFVRTAGERVVLDIVLLGRGSVAGVVRDLANQPVTGAKVVALSASDPQSGGQAVTDGQGRYRIDGITVGPLSVKAAKGIALGRAAGRIDRAGTVSSVDVVLDGGAARVSGTVRRTEGGVTAPVPGVGVVYRIDPAPIATPVGYVKTGADGRFQFDAMPAGQVQLTTSLDTGETAATPLFTVAAGDDLQGKDLLVVAQGAAETGTVEGVILLPGGLPAANALVAVGARGVLTADDGTFRLTGLEVKPGQAQELTATSYDRKRVGRTTFLLSQAGQTVPVVITLSGLGAARFTVLDPAGLPLAGQEVRIVSATCLDPCGCSARTTGSDGSVVYEGISVGSLDVQAVRDMGTGYEAVTAHASVTRDGETGFGLLRFSGLGMVSGLVMDPEGHPTFGADVDMVSRHFVYDGFFCGMVTSPSHHGRTGTDGRFRFTGVGVGPVSLSARQDFYPTPATALGNLTSGSQELSFTLQLKNTTAGVLSGTVFLPDGVTPAGRGVAVTATGGLPEVTVETNDQGQFRFARIFPEGPYRLTLNDSVTGGKAEARVYLRAGQDLSQDLRLKGRGTVRVIVVDGANQPVTTGYVRLHETEFPSRGYESAVATGEPGVATIEGVYEGPFSVEASDVFARGGRASGTMPRAGQIVDIKVRLTSTGTVRGHFLMPDGLTTIPYGVVKLTANGRAIGQVTTAGSGDVGRFSFDYVPSGQARLNAEDPLTGRTGVAVGEIENEGQILDLDVQAQALGTVEGVVTSNGGPQAAASVEVVSGAYRASTLADGTGRYLVRGVPAGRVVATASLSGGFLKGTASGNLDGEGSTLLLDVALRGSGRVTGQVLAADGVTPASLSVVRLFVGGAGGGSLTTLTQDEGRFAFDRVPAGQATLDADVVSSTDAGQALAIVPSGGAIDVPIRLRGIGVLRGTALDSSGLPTAGFVSVTVAGAPPLSLVVGNDGRFEWPEVAAGLFSANLRVTSPGFTLYGAASGEVRPGEITDVNIQVQPSGTVTGIVLRPGAVYPAYGAMVAVRLATGPQVTVQSQAEGRFTARGVPLGALTVSANDPLTAGLAILRGRSLTTNGETLDVGALVLDASPPVLTPVAPAPGSVRATFGGPLLLDVTDDGGVDLPSLTIVEPYLGAAAPFVLDAGRATSTLRTDAVVVGENRFVAQVRDVSGNLTTAEWRFTVTGGTLRGTVLRADGTPAPSAPIRLDTVARETSDAAGGFVISGLRPGQHTLSATDPETGLSASAVLTLGDGEDLTMAEPLRLPAFGRIVGTVRRADGAPAPGVTVAVLFRPGSVTTGPDGRFDLGALALGSYSLNASSADGDRGQALVTLTTLGITVDASVNLNGIGLVRVTLRDGSGALVGGAHVTVSSSSALASPLTGTTASDGGAAVIPSVLAGTISAHATHPTNGLQGEATGLLAAGGTLDLAATLQPTGRIEGTVFRREGGVAAAVEVRLSQPRVETVLTGADGRFAFEQAPLGNWSLTVADATTGDQGQASGVLATAGATAIADVTLNGVGTVRVTVRDAGGSVVPGASVSVTSSAGRGYSALTDGTGLATVPQVLAGAITATAVHPANGTRGTATGTLVAAGQLDLGVALQATGTLRGRVLTPDGLSPVAGASVATGFATATTGADGGYEFTDAPLGTHSLSATVSGRLRARLFVTLTENGQVVDQDLVLVGASPVRGRVTTEAGALVSGAQISVHSLASIYGGVFGTTTDAGGNYKVPSVPLGAFEVSAAKAADRASASGAVTVDGEPVTVDLTLLPSVVNLPLNLIDGNGYQWQIARDGALSHGATFRAPETSSRLTIVRDGIATPFAGPDCIPTCTAATEEGKREVVLPQGALAGLEVTRKAYVAPDAYFARHLDVVRNPGSDPLTVDLRFTTHLLPSSLLTTSSGDTVYEAQDRWITVDDANAANPYDGPLSANSSFWPLGIVTSGAGGLGPSAVMITTEGDGSRTLTETWAGVNLAPGESFGLLRFQTPQVDRARAGAAAERLVELPPEALVGLSLEEGLAVRNFVVPQGLASAVTPLPPNDGVVTGRVLAGDALTPAGARAVVFRSTSLYYGRPLFVTSNGATGAFEVRGAPASSVLVPRMPFDLSSSAVVLGGTRTASGSGDFPLDVSGVPASSTTLDLAYRGTGVIDVTVSRADASPIPSVSLTLSDGTNGLFASTDANGLARFVLIPPGAFTLRAGLAFGPEQTVPVTAVTDQKVTLPVVFADLGAIEGTLRTAAGQPVGGTVTVAVPGVFTRTVSAAAATGLYRLADVPFGSYTVQATDSTRSGAIVTALATVTGTLAVADLQFPPVGRVNVSVRVGSASGAPLQTAGVRWKSEARGPEYVFAGYSNTIGQFSIPFVAGPQFQARADHPSNGNSFGETPLTTITEGQTVDVTVVVPGVGNVAGTLRSRDGVPLAGHPITALALTGPTVLASATADASGGFSLTNVPVGPLRLSATCDTFYTAFHFLGRAEVDATVPSNGTTVAQDALCPLGSISDIRRRDFWTLSATAGETVGFVLAPGVSGAALADPYLEVYGPDGALVAANDDRAAGEKASEVAFAAPADGAYVVVARAAAAEAGAYRLGHFAAANLRTLRTFEPPRVAGVARKDSNSAPVPDQAIRILSGVTPRESVTAGATGDFSLGVFPLGPYAIEATDPEGVVVARATGSAATPGTDVAQDILVPARGTVSVRVRRGTEPLAGLTVALTSEHAGALDEDRLRSRTTGADGTVTTTLPTGPVSARVADPRNGAVYEVGEVLGDGASLTLAIDLPESLTHLFGTVTAADGATPLPGALVSLAGPLALSTTADALGRYEYVSLPPGAYALSAAVGGATSSQAVSLNGGERSVDIQVSVPVLKGRVTEADGTTPVAATVTLCGGSSYSCVTRDTDAIGLYFFYGGFPAWPNGTFLSAQIVAADGSGLTTFNAFSFSTGVATRNFALPAAGAVFGVVRDALGASVAAEVRLQGQGPERALVTAADGAFRFLHVVTSANVMVRAADLEYGLPGSALGFIASDELQLDVTLAPGAELTGQLQDAGGAPLQGEFQLESLPHLALDGYARWTRLITTDAIGRFSTVVPAGGYRAVYDPGTCSATSPTRRLLAVADGTLAAGSNSDLALRLGNGTVYPPVLGGSLGTYGPSADHPARDTVCATEGGVTLTALVGGDPSPPVAGRLSATGQSVTSLLSQVSGLDVRQEQFVPQSGAFLRTITWLQNPDAADVAVDVEVTADFGDGLDWQLTGVSTGGFSVNATATWLHARHEDSASEAGAAWGDGAGSVYFQRGSSGDGVVRAGVVATFSVVVPTGQRLGLMAFVVGRSDGRGVPAQIRSLADLSDPEALEGLSESDRQEIVNFVVPATANQATGVEGTVTRDGLPSANAPVVALDPAEGRVLAYGSTDASGHFVLRGLPAGDVGLVAVDPVTNRPGRTSATVADGMLTTADLAAIPAAEMGTIQGLVSNSLEDPVAGARVTASSSAFAPLWRAEATTGPLGEYSLAAPPGSVHLRVNDDPSTDNWAALDPGGTVVIDLWVP